MTRFTILDDPDRLLGLTISHRIEVGGDGLTDVVVNTLDFDGDHDSTLTVEDGVPRTVNYTHVPADRTFYRNYGTPNEKVLIQGVTEFALRPFTLIQTDATNALETKLLQLDLTAERTGPARALATNNVISARFVMRNKIVAN